MTVIINNESKINIYRGRGRKAARKRKRCEEVNGTDHCYKYYTGCS